MSYEGYTEFLCEKGHYLCYDVHCYIVRTSGAYSCVCEHCGTELKWMHDVDQTNGLEVDDNGDVLEIQLPSLVDAPKKEIGFDDIPHVDHHGNKYFTRSKRYAPVGDIWSLIKDLPYVYDFT